jgi:hypothetical protein
MYQHLPLQEPPKFTQIGIFGLKINHLATLTWRQSLRKRIAVVKTWSELNSFDGLLLKMPSKLINFSQKYLTRHNK